MGECAERSIAIQLTFWQLRGLLLIIYPGATDSFVVWRASMREKEEAFSLLTLRVAIAKEVEVLWLGNAD